MLWQVHSRNAMLRSLLGSCSRQSFWCIQTSSGSGWRAAVWREGSHLATKHSHFSVRGV